MDYRKFYEKELLGAWDLEGRDVTVTISAVKGGTVGHGPKASKKPILSFERTAKKMVANITNARTVAGMYGPDTTKWIGKRITLFATQTTFGAEMHDCIRIRPVVPDSKSKSEGIVGVDPPHVGDEEPVV